VELSGTADLDLNSHKLINVSDPTSAQDGATKSYADTLSAKIQLFRFCSKFKLFIFGIKVSNCQQDQPPHLFSVTSDGSGVLRRLWLALYGTGTGVPGLVFLQILADGELVVGNSSTTTEGIGLNTTALACDLLFSPLGGPFYANSLQGCNVYNTTSLGGYFTLDLPFASNLTIKLVNNNAAAITYWIQPFISTFTTIPPLLSTVKLVLNDVQVSQHHLRKRICSC
jgi:hypothetical protein